MTDTPIRPGALLRAAVSSSAATCLTARARDVAAFVFGTNDELIATWTGLNGNADVTVAYSGFWQIAEAQASSREYGGIHYHFDSLASQEMCPKVAGYVYANYMRPK